MLTRERIHLPFIAQLWPSQIDSRTEQRQKNFCSSCRSAQSERCPVSPLFSCHSFSAAIQIPNMEEVARFDPRQPAAPCQTSAAPGHWPQAPDLQLDCLSSDSDSDDSSIEVISVAQATLNASGSASAGPSSSTSSPHRRPPTSGSLDSKAGPSSSSANAIPSQVAKCPLPIQDPKLAMERAHLPPQPLAVPSAVAKKSHVVIDLTHSDDESGQMFTAGSNGNELSASVRHASRAHSSFEAPTDLSVAGANEGGNSAPRSSCIQENPARPVHHHGHGNRHVQNHGNGFPACRYAQQNAGSSNGMSWERSGGPPIGAQGDTSNNSDPCSSFSNCFVANPSHGIAAAPAAGPCPHSHGFCALPSPHHQVYFPPGVPPPQQVPGYAFAPPIPGMMPGPGPHPHVLAHQFQYAGQPPLAHSHSYQGFPLDPRVHPNQQRLWLSQQRNQELHRQHLYQNSRNPFARHAEPLIYSPHAQAMFSAAVAAQVSGPPQPQLAHRLPPNISHIYCPGPTEANIAWGGLGGQGNAIIQVTANPLNGSIPVANPVPLNEPTHASCGAESPAEPSNMYGLNPSSSSPSQPMSMHSQMEIIADPRDTLQSDMLLGPDAAHAAQIHHHVHQHQHHYHGQRALHANLPGYPIAMVRV